MNPLVYPWTKRLGWFPVVVTGIKAPPLTQKFPFALGVTSCFNNPLEFVLSPFDDPIGQVFCSPKKGFNPILGGGDLSLEAITRNVNFPADIHTDPPPVLTKTRCNSEWPLPQGKKLVISVQGDFGFSKPNSIIDFKIVGVFFGLDSGPKASQLDASRLISTQFYLLVGLRPKTAKHPYRGEDYSTACSTNTSFVQRQFHLEKGHDTKACCGNGEAMRRELPSNGNPFHSRAPYEAYL